MTVGMFNVMSCGNLVVVDKAINDTITFAMFDVMSCTNFAVVDNAINDAITVALCIAMRFKTIFKRDRFALKKVLVLLGLLTAFCKASLLINYVRKSKGSVRLQFKFSHSCTSTQA